MRVICTASYPDKEQMRELGPDFQKNQHFGLTVGKEYLVLGLSYTTHSYCGNTVEVSYFNGDNLIRAPIILFEITNPRVSRYWEAKTSEDGSITLWPPQFYAEYFHDRLSDYEPEATESFEAVYMLLENEDKEAVYQADPCRDPLNEALSDVQATLLTGRLDPLKKHVQPDSTIAILHEGSLDYTLTGREYLDMVSQAAAGSSQATGFVWKEAKWKPDGSVSWFGMLQFGDGSPSATCVSYTLRREECDYFISEVDPSSRPMW